VAVGDGLKDLLTKPLPEFYHPLLMAGGAEVPAFAREGQEILVATIFAFNAGETIVEDAAIKIAADHLFHISTEETVLGGKALVSWASQIQVYQMDGLVGLSWNSSRILP